MSEDNNNLVILYLKSFGISVIINVICVFILSCIVFFSSVSESIINPGIVISTLFSVLIGGYYLACKIKKNGIMYGAILGLFFILFLYLFSSVLNGNFILNYGVLTLLGFGILGGGIGGILGVNLN